MCNLPVDFWVPLWYNTITERERATARKRFQKKSKKGLTNSPKYGTIKMSRGKRDCKSDFKKTSKKTLDKPPKVWYNKYRKRGEEHG